MYWTKHSMPLYLKDLSDKRKKYLEREIRLGIYGKEIAEALRRGQDILVARVNYLKRLKVG
jgi:demethoxyubiquinone hydroxylase (CLK1/Coq7/Cat5 family)